MQTVDESTMDDVITTIDFATLFSQEELKAKRAEEKDRRKKNRFLSVENSHLLAPGGISHSGPGGNRQLWPDENSQS